MGTFSGPCIKTRGFRNKGDWNYQLSGAMPNPKGPKYHYSSYLVAIWAPKVHTILVLGPFGECCTVRSRHCLGLDKLKERVDGGGGGRGTILDGVIMQKYTIYIYIYIYN